jgi:hypothetical protein
MRDKKIMVDLVFAGTIQSNGHAIGRLVGVSVGRGARNNPAELEGEAADACRRECGVEPTAVWHGRIEFSLDLEVLQ